MSENIYDALHDLVPFAQFIEREKDLWIKSKLQAKASV